MASRQQIQQNDKRQSKHVPAVRKASKNRNTKILRYDVSRKGCCFFCLLVFFLAVKIPTQLTTHHSKHTGATLVTVPSHGCILHRFGDCGHIFPNTSSLIAYCSAYF